MRAKVCKVAVGLQHSNQFVRAARAEANRLRLDAGRLREEAGRHLALAERTTAEAIALERRIRELDELLGRAPQLRLDLQTEALRGQQLREAAVEIVARRRKIGEPLHYRDWFKLVLGEGHTVEGKNPLATFLTQVTRSPVVLRHPGPPGVYRVDPQAAGEDALSELEDAEDALLELRRLLSEASDPGDGAETRVLVEQIKAAERRIAAAERSLSEVARIQATLRALVS
jgi:hypothetical protein